MSQRDESETVTHHEVAEAELGPRCLGVDDIDDEELQWMCNTIRHVVYTELGESVEDIYVMGSFARGEARRVASDLDVRVVIPTPYPEEEVREVEQELKNEYGPKIVPSVAGYLDPHISVLKPGEMRGGSPNVEVTA